VKIIKKKKPQNIRSVTIEGFDNIPIKFAKCCNPQPFKNIIGYISSDGYIVIHESVCSSVKEISSQKKINVDWDKANTKDAYFPVVFLIEGISKDSNIDKILEQITKINLNILNISSVIQGDMFNISLEVDILNNKSTSDIMDNLKLIEGVNIVKIV
jgi:(p)ppGpp synthase/HD superfamily hydrolase